MRLGMDLEFGMEGLVTCADVLFREGRFLLDGTAI